MTPAIRLLEELSISHELLTYKSSTKDNWSVQLLESLQLDPDRVFKTLVTSGSTEYIALIPALQTLDLKALAMLMGERQLKLADEKTAQRVTGYQVGGICPIGTRKSLPVVIDTSATHDQYIYISGGKRGLELKLSVNDFIKLTSATVAAVSRP